MSINSGLLDDETILYQKGYIGVRGLYWREAGILEGGGRLYWIEGAILEEGGYGGGRKLYWREGVTLVGGGYIEGRGLYWREGDIFGILR